MTQLEDDSNKIQQVPTEDYGLSSWSINQNKSAKIHIHMLYVIFQQLLKKIAYTNTYEQQQKQSQTSLKRKKINKLKSIQWDEN